MEKREQLISDKAEKFGPGPWCAEPDRIEWREHGLPCLMFRHPEDGHWCGYVGVPPGHPLYETGGDQLECGHGGVNRAKLCDSVICHVPEPGEPEHVWWFGFDCAHYRDLSPGMQRRLPYPPSLRANLTYRDEAYVRQSVSELCAEIANVKAQCKSTPCDENA